MATAYAVFTSLMNLITQLHEHQLPPIQLDEKQVDSLSSTIGFFLRFLEVHHNAIDLGLEFRIADAAYAAEDLIETHIADRVLEQKDFDASLQRLIEGMDVIKNELMEMMKTKNENVEGNIKPATRHLQPPLASSQSPSPATSGERILVGMEEATIKIVDKLTSQQKADRQIISISGMAGIGKTTLAREVYDNLYVRSHFDICAWSTISKDYNSSKCLVELLLCIDSTWSKVSLSEKSEHDLGIQFYQSLFGKRYLVILDDIWDIEAWHRMRSFFPASSGSGIVITARESTFASISSYSFRVELLDESKSWDLFCKKAFGRGSSCPPELENVGRNVANKCGGLPLSILVIGGHLAKSPRTQEYWEYVADNLSSVVNSEDNERCLKILSLSYNRLPVHLKPCFLYMSIFPEDEEIPASRLVKVWVAEGFLKPINGKSLEEAAEVYLNDLVGRNLVLASSSILRRKIKDCKLHDLLRDFSFREAQEKKFLCVVRKVDDLGLLNNKRRIVVHSTMQHRSAIRDALKSQPLLCTLIFDGTFSPENKLVRVLLCDDETQISGLVNLGVRFLYLERFLSSICLFWNLQYLYIISYRRLNTTAPPEFWKMTQMRHIKVRSCLLLFPDPPSESDHYVMKNLRAAKRIANFDFRKDIVERIPNIKNLAVCYDDSHHNFSEGACNLNNVSRLQRLESFRCIFTVPTVTALRILANLTLPHSLRKLKISDLCWDDVTKKIGSLPQLQVLKLHRCSGRRWKLVEGQFVKLKFLKLYCCLSLRYVKADKYCFPRLQGVVLQELDRLKGISSEIGDIETLKSIEVKWCPDSAVVSAKKIADEQCDLGNEELQVKAILLQGSSLSAESMSTSNFHIVEED